MFRNNKTAWLESQYLFPHHFQQHERYFEQRIEQRSAYIKPYIWGFSSLELDTSLLSNGSIGLLSAEGVLPDGTPFSLPKDAPLPAPLTLAKNAKDVLVFLVLPLYQPGGHYLDMDKDSGNGSAQIARYKLDTTDVFDYTGMGSSEPVEVAVMQFRLEAEGKDLGGYACLPITRVREVTQEGAAILEKRYIVPCLDVRQHNRLKEYLDDAIGLLKQRGEALAERFVHGGQSGGAAAVADFMLLQLVNRYEPRLRHLAQTQMLHPERLYMELVGLMGELATFTTRKKRPPDLPAYTHGDLYRSFQPLMDIIGRHLSAVLEQTATALPVEPRQYGIHVARIADHSMVNQCRFVLAVKADVSTDVVKDRLPSNVKVGSVETIRNLVNNQLPGIKLTALPIAPREIAYHAGSVYFELDSSSPQWEQFRESGGFAFHVTGELPGVNLELWAIRK